MTSFFARRFLAEPLNTRDQSGFNLIELLIVVAIIGILSSVILASLNTARDKARLAETKQEFRSIRNALALYYHDHGQYPPDVNRSLPPDLMGQYLTEDIWPSGSWEEAVYDWESWDRNGDGLNDTFQISLRCGTADDHRDDCRYFEITEWDNAGDCTENDNSALYYCLKGACTPHEADPSTCGKCLNPEQVPGCEA